MPMEEVIHAIENERIRAMNAAQTVLVGFRIVMNGTS